MLKAVPADRKKLKLSMQSLRASNLIRIINGTLDEDQRRRRRSSSAGASISLLRFLKVDKEYQRARSVSARNLRTLSRARSSRTSDWCTWPGL